MAKEVAMTYRELATRLGIKLESARKTVRRKDWKRVDGSDGIVKILVPDSYLAEMGAAFAAGSVVMSDPGRRSRNETAIEFLEDVLEAHNEKLGPILKAAMTQLDRDIIKRLVLDVAAMPVTR